MMNIGDPPGDGILDGDHAQRSFAIAHGGEGVLERAARQGGHFGSAGTAGKIGISAGFSLEGDGLLRVGSHGTGSFRRVVMG